MYQTPTRSSSSSNINALNPEYSTTTTLDFAKENAAKRSRVYDSPSETSSCPSPIQYAQKDYFELDDELRVLKLKFKELKKENSKLRRENRYLEKYNEDFKVIKHYHDKTNSINLLKEYMINEKIHTMEGILADYTKRTEKLERITKLLDDDQ